MQFLSLLGSLLASARCRRAMCSPPTPRVCEPPPGSARPWALAHGSSAAPGLARCPIARRCGGPSRLARAARAGAQNARSERNCAGPLLHHDHRGGHLDDGSRLNVSGKLDDLVGCGSQSASRPDLWRSRQKRLQRDRRAPATAHPSDPRNVLGVLGDTGFDELQVGFELRGGDGFLIGCSVAAKGGSVGGAVGGKAGGNSLPTAGSAAGTDHHSSGLAPVPRRTGVGFLAGRGTGWCVREGAYLVALASSASSRPSAAAARRSGSTASSGTENMATSSVRKNAFSPSSSVNLSRVSVPISA